MTANSLESTGGTPEQLLIRHRIEESAASTAALLEGDLAERIALAASAIVDAYRHGRKLLAFGNGGSAADAQHLAAELCGRFLVDRRPLPAIALGDNVSSLTAIANDYSFADVFAREVNSLGEPGDVAIGISTSGESENVIRGIESAREKGLVTVGLVGASGGRMQGIVDHCLRMSSSDVPRIQEAHALVGHILCELVERALFTDHPL